MGNTILKAASTAEALEQGFTTDTFEKLTKDLGRVPTISEIKISGMIWPQLYSSEYSGKVELGNNTNYEFRVNSHLNNTHDSSSLIAQINSIRLGELSKKENISLTKKTLETLSKENNINNAPIIANDVFFDQNLGNLPLINTFSVKRLDSKKETSPLNLREIIQSEETINSIAQLLGLDRKNIKVKAENMNIQLLDNDEIFATLPLDFFSKNEFSINENQGKEPDYFLENKNFDINQIKEPEDLKELASFLLKQPNIASKRWINDQFNTLKRSAPKKVSKNSDAAIEDTKDSKQSILLSVNGNSRYIKADPYIGTALAIAEASRNIICSGGRPLAISACLNLGDLASPETKWQHINIEEALSTASKKFDAPVVDKVISFNRFSETAGKKTAISPAPAIGMLGLLEEKNKTMTFDFKHKGDLIFILGEAVECIGSSEYLTAYHGVTSSPAPYFDMNKEYELHKVLQSLVKNDLINAAHNCSIGGTFIALTEMAMPNELGFDIVTDAEIREDAFLFGESGGRVLVGVNEKSEDAFIEFMMNSRVNFTLLGHVTQGKLVVDDEHFGFIQEAKKSYNKALEEIIEG
ncbi:AIR synthase-related protein [Brumimicrobium oceani]|uniref:Phosphoribosylformylglycinamidine synthase n=1 Tax=Brumimicrobium oceani TaxID=2100725 RepID=A0A2U2XCI5_9FLAO|nr:AIR synthase-related protein [Brumimicrobium oceani]PWH85460.1 hypothetical protein DIT68_09390 [Brumimicrobium oceani]